MYLSLIHICFQDRRTLYLSIGFGVEYTAHYCVSYCGQNNHPEKHPVFKGQRLCDSTVEEDTERDLLLPNK